MRRWLVFSFLLSIVAVSSGAETPSTTTHAASSAPQFELPTRKGTVSLDSLRGKVVFVDFWASWCDPCRSSFPWMKSLHDHYASKGLVIVAVNLDKKREAADEFLEKFPAPFVVAFDPAGKTAEAFKVSRMPSSYLVGRDGRILHEHAGYDPKNTNTIEALIQEACSR